MNKLLFGAVLWLAVLACSAFAGTKGGEAPKTPRATGAVIKTGGPHKVEEVRNLAYHDAKDADPVRHKLDLYLPRGQKDFPVLFFVHGGAWRSGNKDLYAPLGQVFAKNGVGVVVINYRLSPKVKHPAHIEDVARAFAWTHRNIKKYGGRTDQLFTCGHSAGGHLVGLLATDESYLKAHKLSLKDIKAVIPMSGVYTIAPLGSLQAAFGKDAAVCKAASPLTHVKEKHPPALIIYAEKDYLTLDVMAEQFCKKLKGCRCEAESLKVADRDHISIIVRMVSETDPTAQAVLQFIARHSELKLTEKK
ncbi:MAG: alpha/beta hydrolase [Gemmataceae bacterium]|nr:alpha/beta hydrolase [Gemmataceae bacterium]